MVLCDDGDAIASSIGFIEIVEGKENQRKWWGVDVGEMLTDANELLGGDTRFAPSLLDIIVRTKRNPFRKEIQIHSDVLFEFFYSSMAILHSTCDNVPLTCITECEQSASRWIGALKRYDNRPVMDDIDRDRASE